MKIKTLIISGDSVFLHQATQRFQQEVGEPAHAVQDVAGLLAGFHDATAVRLYLDVRPSQSTELPAEALRQLMADPQRSFSVVTLGERLLPRSVLSELVVLQSEHRPWGDCTSRSDFYHETAQLPFRRVSPRMNVSSAGLSLFTYEPRMIPVLQQLVRIADRDVTLLIAGETGTGKTTVAQLIHLLSSRATQPFLHLACGALPKDLIESELFGHARGAFTGADRQKVGRFEAAGQGTLLLDEIDTLGPNEQAKLLKVIETGEYEPVGLAEPRRSRARLIVASNECLESLTRQNRFRSDLYYRLNVLEFRLPPLRERPLDLLPLALQFIDESCREYDIVVDHIHEDVLDLVRRYPWPGNLRELKNHLRRAVLFCNESRLTVNDLSPQIVRAQFETSEAAPSVPPAWTLADRVATSEREILEQALRANNYRRTTTARALGISRVGLYKKMKKYGMLDSQVSD
jgi:transcriptional regulator with PAS, ATPase and Fis domain